MKSWKLSAGLLILFFGFVNCQKALDIILTHGQPEAGSYYKYIIEKGSHTANYNIYTPSEYSELRFIVKFDSTAIYETTDPLNQYDVNKLYGFSDNNAHHHTSSARFGWSWSEGSLRLYAYVYDQAVLAIQELGIVQIGAEITCSIVISATSYVFSAGDKSIQVPRTSSTPTAIGYKLFPYFGGDEPAPHRITIRIKEL